MSRLVRVLPHDPDHGVAVKLRRRRDLSRETKIGMGVQVEWARVLPHEPGLGGPVRRAQVPGAGTCERAMGWGREAALAGLAGATGLAVNPHRSPDRNHDD